MSELDASIIVCTRDRPRQLERLLESVRMLRTAADLRWEMLIVDNGTTADAAAVVDRFERRLPIRRIVAPMPGLAGARNAGVDAAAGALICWTDDDVVLPPDWLDLYWRASLAFPQADVFGGGISPRAEQPEAPWFSRRMRQWPISSVVAYRDLGPRPSLFVPCSNFMPWGANYAVRSAAQRRFRYDPALVLAEETDLISRLLRDGGIGRWLPESSVTHMIPPARQSRSYVADYFRRTGRTAAYLWARDGLGNPIAPGAPSWTDRNDRTVAAVRRVSMVAAATARLVGGPGAGLRALARSSYLDGVRAFRDDVRAVPAREVAS